ncbi:presequence protease [Chloropicon primus]|nr:presequence protease [Chloropicon primus]|eukprot:QDZ25312.1 presequence protease [Chloropicon primus]
MLTKLWRSVVGNGACRARHTLRAYNGTNKAAFSVASPDKVDVQIPVAVSPEVAKKHGFEVIKEEFVKEYGSNCVLYRHTGTGAELMSVHSADENKTFGAVFRTPVEDSTGVPHILEHSVLCGSRKYPIKEPFVELMKSSLNTFLNAFTYPDRTCYPVASCNTRDFYNLVDVYLDAVFYPRCAEKSNPENVKIFEQEGWHHELDSPDPSQLQYKGVVFNEMKGVYSSPDSVLGRVCQQALFPEITYGVDSGGDPRYITDLTYEQFCDFHSDFYHPSNTRFWFYGDDDPETRLEILSNYLKDFEANQAGVEKSRVLTQKKFTEPRTVTDYYAVSESEDPSQAGQQKAYVNVNWVLEDDVFDLETQLAFGFLDFILLGTSGSPLRKALIDSGLGEAVCGGGLEDELRQPTFSIGLKGVESSSEENLKKVETLVLETLESLAEKGFSDSSIEAALNTIEFSLRENNTGSFPRGLSLMLRSMQAWIYDKDPLEPLKWEDQLEGFKAKLKEQTPTKLFGDLIRKYLIDNPHRVTVNLLPNTALQAELDGEEQGKLDELRKGMTDEDMQELMRKTQELKTHQETPDPAEALKCIPTLDLADIPKESQEIPSSLRELTSGGEKVDILSHDIFTNDVVYAEFAFDMSSVPKHLLYLIPLFCRCLTEMGTTKEDFVELTERIGRKTGGLSAYSFTSALKDEDKPSAYIIVRGKSTKDKFGDYCEIVEDIIQNVELDNKERFKQMVLETIAGQEAAMVGRGHTYAIGRLHAQRDTASAAGEYMGGVANYHAMKGLAEKLDADWDQVHNDLKLLKNAIFKKKGMLVNLTADEKTLTSIDKDVAGFVDSLPDVGQAPSDQGSLLWYEGKDSGLLLPKQNELLVVPTQVNYVGKCTNMYKDTPYKQHGSSVVISKYLSTTWLWDRVRVVGGAYGGFCSFDNTSGHFSFMSYRDPNLSKTIDNYDGSTNFLKELTLDKDELTKSIIATMGDIDSYQLPDSKGYTAFMRHLLKVTDEERQQRRDEILSTKLQDFKDFGDALQSALEANSQVCAVTSKDMAKQAEEERKDLGFVTSQVL